MDIVKPVFSRVFNSTIPDVDWNPLSLFTQSEPGFWYDPSDITTLFQDSTGLIPVTTAGQSVGKVVDKSGRGNHATQAIALQRPTYQIDGTGRPYLLFDGSLSGMLTGTITPNTDKAQVFIGLRKLSDAAAAIVIEASANSGSNSGTLAILAPQSASSTYRFTSKGTTAVNAALSGYVAPITNVLCGFGDISASVATLRVNGEQISQVTTTQGTGNYLAYPLYIGRRGGASLPFNGRIYSMIVRFGANLAASQITSAESWVNSKTGSY